MSEDEIQAGAPVEDAEVAGEAETDETSRHEEHETTELVEHEAVAKHVEHGTTDHAEPAEQAEEHVKHETTDHAEPAEQAEEQVDHETTDHAEPAESAEPTVEHAAGETTAHEEQVDHAEHEKTGQGEQGATETEDAELEEADGLDATEIPLEEQEEFRRFYRLLRRGRGYIEGREVHLLLEALGQEFSCQDAVHRMMEERGLDAHSQLRLAEIVTLVSGVYQTRTQVMESLLNSFRFFNKDGSGFLEQDELYRAVFKVGNKALEESARQDFQKLVQLADTNKDGRIDYAKFCQLLTMGFEDLQNQMEN